MDASHSRRGSISSKRGKSFLDIEEREEVQDLSVIGEDSGLIPRILHDIIEGMRSQDTEEEDGDMQITFSFLEIYNEKIRDLLLNEDDKGIASPDAFSSASTAQIVTLKVREHPLFGPYVEGLSKPLVATAEEALKLLSLGLSRRTTTETAWNAHSSRSHAVVTLEISQAGRYATNASANQSVTTRSNLFSPTVSFTHSTKNSNGNSSSSSSSSNALHSSMSPDISSFYNGETSFSSANPMRDPDMDSRHFVRVQLVDLAGSEKDPMQPSRVPREGDEMDLISSTSKSAKKTHFANPSQARNNIASSHGHSSEGFGGLGGEKAGNSNTNEMRMIRRSLSTLGYIIKALGEHNSWLCSCSCRF